MISVKVRIRWTAIQSALGVKKTPEAARRVQLAPLPPMASTKPTLAVLVEQRLSVLADAWKWLQNRSKITQRNRSLRVCESAQLGEKRIIALIQADDQRFLIGGTSNSITLLATLTSLEDFRSLLPKDALSEVQE